MAKANFRAQRSKHRTHALEDEYKIPIKDRKEFMGNRKAKWVGKKKYMKYVEWKKRHR